MNARAAPVRYPPRPLRYRLLNQVVRRLPVRGAHALNGFVLGRALGPADAGMAEEMKVAGAPAVTLALHEADESAVAAIVAHPEALPEFVYRNRVAAGDRCLVLHADGEPVAYNWVSHARCCVLCGYPQAIEFATLAPGEAFTYDFYTYRAQRGRGYGHAIKRRLLARLAAEGVGRVCTVVMPHAGASLKIHLALGYRMESMVYGYRVNAWQYTRCSRARERPALEAWLAAFAEGGH